MAVHDSSLVGYPKSCLGLHRWVSEAEMIIEMTAIMCMCMCAYTHSSCQHKIHNQMPHFPQSDNLFCGLSIL